VLVCHRVMTTSYLRFLLRVDRCVATFSGNGARYGARSGLRIAIFMVSDS
jgi:hypothetical protein